ncbi:MAG: hypothetical protein WBM14_07195, partial [Terracidiphilus sp.]
MIGGVLEQSADEVGHAGDERADGDVLAQAQASGDDRPAEGLIHAVEHLDFERGRGQVGRFQRGQGVGDGAQIVRADGQVHAAFADPSRRSGDEQPREPLEARIGVGLVRPHRRGPVHELGVDGFVIPIGAFD